MAHKLGWKCCRRYDTLVFYTDARGSRTIGRSHAATTAKGNIEFRTPQIRKKCSTMSQTPDTQQLDTCLLSESAADLHASVKCILAVATLCPPTPYGAAGRVHGSRKKSKGGLEFVSGPIRKTPQRRNPLPHNTFRQTATPANPEISILGQETDRHLL